MRQPRTVLENLIFERRQTLEEFAEYIETFCRENDEPATLGLRHLQRLASGHKPKGGVRVVTARLLERIFGLPIDELLAPPPEQSADGSTDELRRMLHAWSRVNSDILALLHEQMSSLRRLDRQLGAIIAHDEVHTKAVQIDTLLVYSASDRVRRPLATILSEIRCLVGWQALDLGQVHESWKHYDKAKSAALESGSPAFEAHAEAGLAFVLIDAGETASAVELLSVARRKADRHCSRMMRAWIAAAHGEALAADNQHPACLQEFDAAAALLPHDVTEHDGPYLALDAVHLARWRGHALSRVADPEAAEVLTDALDRLDSTFVRAETGLRVDLATALASIDEREEAQTQASRAAKLATQIGSTRQKRRMHTLCQSIYVK